MEEKPIKIALASEEDRYQSVFKSLDLLFEDISPQIYRLDPKEDYILVKPNCIDTHKKAAVTDLEALRAVLDFIQPLWTGRVIVAEGSGCGNTMEAFKNFHYLTLKNDFPKLEFLDLNFSNSIFIDIFDRNLKPLSIKISDTVAEAPLRISVGPPKTHDSTIVTLSIKNMAVGSMLKDDKAKIHQGPKAINRSIVAINQYTKPHLSVIDGWIAMEGDGPVDGQSIETHFAVSSCNALAADTFTTERMGFNPLQVGYLNLLGAAKIRKRFQVLGRKAKDFTFRFKPHQTYLNQIEWE